MNIDVNSLKDTKWLAQRLGLSLTTVERLRAHKSPDLPQHMRIGSSVRYHEEYVERWIEERLAEAVPKGVESDALTI
jgi:predicted DNA-binding transcriptional regulator AlpA